MPTRYVTNARAYTALYHALLHPNTFDEVNGEYPGYDGKVHMVARGRRHYVTYAGWDTYRGQAQLTALLFPKVGSDINQSIVDMVQQTGTWSNWPHPNQAQQKMSGTSPGRPWCRPWRRPCRASPATAGRRRRAPLGVQRVSDCRHHDAV